MLKKGLLIILFLSLFLVAGCENQTEDGTSSVMVHEHCTRAGSVDNGTVGLDYDLYYTGEVLNMLVGVEKVSSSSSEVLDTYEAAYKEIHTHYKGLDYYTANVVRDETYVMNSIIINYDKIDINQLLSIEGEEDNIVENGVAKVAKWKSFAEQFGTSCELVED